MNNISNQEIKNVFGGGYGCKCYAEGSAFDSYSHLLLESKRQCINYCCNEKHMDYYAWAFIPTARDKKPCP